MVNLFKNRLAILVLLTFFQLLIFPFGCWGKEKKKALPPELKKILPCGNKSFLIEGDALELSGRLLGVYDLSQMISSRKLAHWRSDLYQPVILKIKVLDYPCRGTKFFLLKQGVKLKAPVGSRVEFLINYNTCSSSKRCPVIIELSGEE